MKRYNEVYRKLGENWKKASDRQKHILVKQMFVFLGKENIEQEKEYAILDFMGRHVFGTTTSIDTTGIRSCGFSHYAK